MDRKEMEAKLTKHGLPTWGTDKECLHRLAVNGIIVFDVNPSSPVSVIVKDEEPERLIVKEAPVEPAPRKMGRPKKVK